MHLIDILKYLCKMSQISSENVDLKYYYNRKSKFFQDHSETSSCSITVNQFLNNLSSAYLRDDEEYELDFYMNSPEFLRATRIEIFSELLDVDESSLYSVVNECEEFGKVKLNENELFRYCDYLLNIPSHATLTLHSDTSKESLTSLSEEPMFKNDNNPLLEPIVIASSNSLVNKGILETHMQRIEEGILLPGLEHSTVTFNNKILSERNIIIRVKDNSKKVAKDFEIPKELLVSKMGYFTDKNLNNSKINIRCNLNIFNWIMGWIVQCDPTNNYETSKYYITSTACNNPLNSKNVIQFLVCVSLLKIEELINMCLCYCKNNINEVLKSTRDFSLLDDDILDRLADLFSNVDVEALTDKKDKIKSILYCKLITSLSLPEPEPWKGHFSSLAYLFKCTYCNKLVMHKIANSTPCLLNNVQLKRNGEISIIHVADPNWNLSEYVGNLRKELKSWRKVYWRLWAECHFLYCIDCKSYYSMYYYDKCCYHPEEAQFFLGKQTETYLSGYYPCCGTKSYRYESVVHLSRGCTLRNHTPILKNNRISSDIMKLLQRFHRYIFPAKSNGDNSSCSSEIRSTSKTQHDNAVGDQLRFTEIYHNIGNDGHFKLPYFIANEKGRGLLGHGLCKRKQKGGAKGDQSWMIDTSRSLYPKTSSSVELFTDVNEKKHQTTLVGLIMQLERTNSVSSIASNTSSTSYSNSELNSQFDVEEGESNSFYLYSASSDNYLKPHICKTYKQKRNTIKTSERYMTRINQDNQRECERNIFALANSILTRKIHKKHSFTRFNNTDLKSFYKTVSLKCDNSVTSLTSSSPSSSQSSLRRTRLQKPVVWNSNAPLAGTYKRIDSEWERTKKYVATRVLCNNSFNNLKKCFHCKYQTTAFKKLQLSQISSKCDINEKSIMLSTSSHHQEYHSSVYKPVLLQKEFKLERYKLNVDWPNVIDLEQKWAAFLKLIDENEIDSFEEAAVKDKYSIL